MNIEKVKEALAACAGIENIVKQIEQYEEYTDGSPMLGTCRGLYEIKKAAKLALSALAELEKPGESLEAVEKWAEEYYGHSVLVGDIHRSLAVAFTAFAASYHAKKCAECGNVVCPDCKGLGYTAEHDPSGNAHDEEGNCLGCCPIQVQCEKCNGTGKI